jgi:hypothetical protein
MVVENIVKVYKVQFNVFVRIVLIFIHFQLKTLSKLTNYKKPIRVK